MLLTITYEGDNTHELGYLLHKNPQRPQQFSLSFGKAYVFYPEVSRERTTAALLLDLNPIELARGKLGSNEGGLFDYVNDRPYASTSFMSTALVRIFGSAMGGRCEKRQALADTPLNLTAQLYCLKDGGSSDLAGKLFEPLGYTVETVRTVLDERFPEWGASPYINLKLRGQVRLAELLNHLYVLIPVFDRQKHYYVSEDEIKKLLDHGAGWLASHPWRNLIAKRYFHGVLRYAHKAIDKLLDGESADAVNREDQLTEPGDKEIRTPLNEERLEIVKNMVLTSGASSVIDLGCGEGRLTALLLNEQQLRRVTACDVSVRVLEKAAQRLRLDRMNPHRRQKLTLMQASLTYKDMRLAGYDCACVVEVIEHIEPGRLPAFERAIFEFASPLTVIITTPNSEYNINYDNLLEEKHRHSDHRFEWTRAEFRAWTDRVCQHFGYSCEIRGIGPLDERCGTPTQMGVFKKNG